MTHFFALILFPIIVTLGGVHGRTLSQPPMLTPLTQIGQEFHCVEFYKQPAFDHPLLKHLIPKVQLGSSSTTSNQVKFNIVDGGCPNGTVPILSSGVSPPPLSQLIEHSTAVVRTNTNQKFYGSRAQLSLHKAATHGNQWSRTRLRLSNGGDSVETGWMVYPQYYKDNEAHFYARFTSGSKTCLNLDCPGFVQVAQDLPLGSNPRDYSTIGGAIHMWDMSIDKHKDDGNWWLSMTLGTTRQVGYWPGNIFEFLSDAAIEVEWGGEVNDPGAVEPGPAMGSGLVAKYDQSTSAFFQQVTVVDENFNHVIPHGTEKSMNSPSFYTVLDWGNKNLDDHGRIISYGGPQLR